MLLLVVVVIASLGDRAGAAEPGAESEAGAEVACTVTDERIDEQSGLAVSAAHEGLAYVVNDSGSDPAVYALDLATCEVVGVTVVRDVAWRDPEALALDGEGTLWIADTGDNAGVRDDAALYALPEPGRRDSRVTPTVHPVAFETGREDVETLLIDPTTGATWVVTKGLLGGELLALPDELPQDPRPEGTVSTATSTGASMPILATDGAVTPDGRYAVVRTYLAMHLYELGEEVTKVSSTTLPPQEQGETIAVDPSGTSVLVGSEGVGQPLYRLPLVTPEPVEPALAPEPQAAPASDGSASGESGSWWERPVVLAGLAGGVTIILAGALVARARRRG